MESSKTFRYLIVWNKAHLFVRQTYSYTREFPADERFGLTSQLRRAAVSVPANISEGFVKKSQRDKIRFLNIAQGSLEECRYYLMLSEDLEYGQTGELQQLAEEVSKLLSAYMFAIQRSLH